MADVKITTAKRLYAVSGNRCAFPNCKNPLVEPDSGTVTGRICHIKARSKDGPRYDPDQTDEERNGFANLVIMCPIHHDVIDADSDSYTVNRLLEIKAMHEALSAKGPEANDDIIAQLLVNLGTLSDGSIIYASGQQGGQVAHSITNIAPSPYRDLQVKAYFNVLAAPSPMGKPITVKALAVKVANVGTATSYISSIAFSFLVSGRVEKRTIFGPMNSFRNAEDQLLSRINPTLPFAIVPGDSKEYNYRVSWLRDAMQQLGCSEFPIEVIVTDKLDNMYSYLIPKDATDRLLEAMQNIDQ